MSDSRWFQGRSLSSLGPIGSMIAATGLWAVSLIAPLILDAYTPVEITAGRYLFYGAVSAAILVARFRHCRLGPQRWARAAFYGLSGNLAVPVLVCFAIQTLAQRSSFLSLGCCRFASLSREADICPQRHGVACSFRLCWSPLAWSSS
jgi:hypothetical protein